MKIQEIPISTEYIKASAFLKLAGVCATGGQAKLMIEQSQVSINGEICLMRGKKLHAGDIISITNGETFRIV